MLHHLGKEESKLLQARDRIWKKCPSGSFDKSLFTKEGGFKPSVNVH